MQYTIRYHKGPENRVADALSRFPEPNAECVALLVATPTWTQAVADSYKDDSVAQHMITILAVDPVVVSHFSLCDGLQGASLGGQHTGSSSATPGRCS